MSSGLVIINLTAHFLFIGSEKVMLFTNKHNNQTKLCVCQPNASSTVYSVSKVFRGQILFELQTQILGKQLNTNTNTITFLWCISNTIAKYKFLNYLFLITFQMLLLITSYKHKVWNALSVRRHISEQKPLPQCFRLVQKMLGCTRTSE